MSRNRETNVVSEKLKISNPVLMGFNPDPSICRVEDDYYIATSTFEWFPGVQIHHSRDLVHWRLVTHPLNRTSQLDMRGVPDSGGVWAPCLTWNEGLFYLVYTNVHELNSVTKDTPNYLVTAPNILGPWSEPVYLNSSGFDPSLFHDDDGRKWLVNMVWDHRPGNNPFYGIILQEYSPIHAQLVGEPQLIFKGTSLGCTEAPHLYKRNHYYYLVTAEGGTEWKHAVTLARSRRLAGPYEVHPQNPILTSNGDSSLALQKSGHADIVQTQQGDWYMVHLCSRPLPYTDRCILGRETAIQKVIWRNDWLYLASGGQRPEVKVTAPDLPVFTWEPPPNCDDFDEKILGIHFATPRVPLDETSLSLTERPGFLRLKGGQSLQSRFNQVLVARRQQAFQYQATTLLEFAPQNFQQMAGLVCYYSTKLYHYLLMSYDEKAGPCLYVQSANNGEIYYPMQGRIIILENYRRVWLRANMDHARLDFLYSLDGEHWKPVYLNLDASILSDDYAEDWGFTGAFVGLACQDLTGGRTPADFDFFDYHEGT